MQSKQDLLAAAGLPYGDPEGRLRELGDDSVRNAKLAILAAKAAYQLNSVRWLTLLSLATAAIEQCPPDLQPTLLQSLDDFYKKHPFRRPRPK